MLQEKTIKHTLKRDGCQLADRELNRLSSCFDCPFSDCILGNSGAREANTERNEQIRQEWQNGTSVALLSSKYKLTKQSIRKIVR